jgi:CRP/FNR family cyclic AMP-dependent transcriptional regulator
VRSGQSVATIADPGVVLGEISALLDQSATATVLARDDVEVKVIDDPIAFMTSDPAVLLDVARTLAGRLARMSGYLVDVKQQYSSAGGHLGLLDDVLSELSFGQEPSVDPGSERDPDPLY